MFYAIGNQDRNQQRLFYDVVDFHTDFGCQFSCLKSTKLVLCCMKSSLKSTSSLILSMSDHVRSGITIATMIFRTTVAQPKLLLNLLVHALFQKTGLKVDVTARSLCAVGGLESGAICDTLFSVAQVFSILYTNWRCIQVADVVGGRPDFIMAESCHIDISSQWTIRKTSRPINLKRCKKCVLNTNRKPYSN
jgi:hypothetical protein